MTVIPVADPIGVCNAVLIGQGHPRHPTGPNPRKGRLEQGITGRHHQKSVLSKARRDFQLGLGNRLTAAEPPDMRRPDIGHHGHVRSRRVAQAFNLPQSPHAHFDNHRLVLFPGIEQGERNPDVVVFVALAGLHRPQRPQCGANQFAGCGLPGRARDGHHRSGQLLTVQQRQLLIGLQGVVDEPMQQPFRNQILPVLLDDRGLGTDRGRLGQKGMAIKVFTHQRDKQLSSRQPAAIGANGANNHVGIPSG